MVGQNIGKYRVLDRVGRGGMGTVYRAIDETLHREVAIKVLNAELNDPEVAKRFRAEAITVARLSHPGIATIYELFQHDGQWLMVMEFVRGETLERLIERAGPQAADRAAELCMHSLAALAHAHSMGVVHRDLKPANIMLTENGVIKIMDFGIARVAGTEHLTNAGFMMGTPAYMAPEQVLGHEIDARADLYAIGVVFYRLLTGQLPFKGETPFAMAQAQVNNPPTPIGTFRGDLPPWVDDVMAKSLAKKPDDRFQSAVEFHERFSRSLSGQPVSGAYRSSAPTNLMMTPPPLSTGAVPETILATTPRSGTAIPPPAASVSRAVPDGDSGAGPTIAAGTPAALVRPPTGASSGAVPVAPSLGGPLADDPSGAQTVLSPSGAQAVIAGSGAQPSDLFGSGSIPAAKSPSGAIPNGASGSLPAVGPHGTPVSTPRIVAEPAPPPAMGPGSATVAAPGAAPSRKSSTGLVAAAAAVLLAIALGGYFLLRPRPPEVPAAEAPPAEPTTVAATPPAEPSPAPVPAPTTAPPAVTPPAPAAPARGAGGPAAGPAPAPLTPGAVTPAGAPAAGTAAGAAVARGGPAPPTPPPADDPLLAVTNVRVLVVTGKKADDQEILLNFGNGQIVIVNARSGTPIATMPYRSIVSATYVRARDPRWNAAWPSPPEDLDVGGMLRTSKHFLALQSKDGYQILRLEDVNVIRVLQAIEARTGITVDRPKPGDRN